MDLYGNDDWNEEDLGGLTIVDEFGSVSGEMDEADAWLAQMEQQAVDSGDGASFQEELIGAATPATLQLGRIGHVEPRIQAGIKAVLSGQSVDGIHPVDAAAAREQFASEIGQDPKEFARQIKLDEVVQVPRHQQDLKTVISMLQNTSGEYMERGPGGQLIGNIQDAEKQMEADADLQKAIGYISELADLYIDDRTRGSSVEPARRRALEESITKRLIDGTFYEGSKDILPLPNETGVTGIIRTQGIYGSAQGTAEDRLSAGQFDSAYKTVGSGVKTRFLRDENGYKVFKDNVDQKTRADILRRTPSLANSLFPKPRRIKDKTYSISELEKQTRDQQYALSQAQFKAEEARRILRRELPSTRDESKGQIRMTGWDTPYDEQADLQNLRNEAAIQGIDWNTFYAGQGEDSQQSELTDFIEREREKPLSTDGEIKQGTQAWLNQRKGKITASTAAGLLKAGGVEERALELAMERLGTADKFTGNADTREGNEGEKKAARAFMSGPGRGLVLQEAYFEENPEYQGFGVSPDGRLYDQDGNSKGLLELKYLSTGSMKGALAKYTPQMQMQMAITGESQTNFYALDKFTGEYVHEVVEADPAMQEQLIAAGRQALEMGADLDNRGVQALRKQIQSAKPRKGRQPSSQVKVTGQQESFAPKEEVEEEAVAFDPTQEAVARITQGSGQMASETTLARKLEQIDQRERAKEAIANAVPSEEVIKDGGTTRTKPNPARASFIAGNQRPAFGDNADNSDMAAFYRDMQKEAAEASKEASQQVRNFGNAVQKAGQVLGELGGLVAGGNASGMSEVRLAAETGQDVEAVRGTREALEMGGLDTAGASRMIMQAGNLTKTFNEEASAAAKYTSILTARGRSNLESVRTMDIPSIQELQNMEPQQWTSMVAGLMEGKSPQEKAQIGEIFGMTELATYDQDPAAINARDSSIDGEAQRATYRGLMTVEQQRREVSEQLGEVGETGGMVAGGAQVASAVVGSATAGVLGTMAAKTSTAQKLMSQAAKAGPMAAKAVKTASVAAKANPVAIAATAAPMAIRAIGDIKDDGSVGDSAMDVLEFASYGAAVGSIVPGVGTLAGAGVGAAVGLANEAWEWFNTDDAVPNANIGAMPSQTQQTDKQAPVTNVNVDVTNEISPDLIRTTTDIDGDISIDEDSSLNTGG